MEGSPWHFTMSAQQAQPPLSASSSAEVDEAGRSSEAPKDMAFAHNGYHMVEQRNEANTLWIDANGAW
jgi:hypothetical protein